MRKWNRFVHRVKEPSERVTIVFVGKYTELKDAYKSISEAFIHSGADNDVAVDVKWIRAEEIDQHNVAEHLQEIHGLLVAPGFGIRGIEGKIKAIQYVRENKIPFFGICLGMQCAVIEYGRHVLGLKDAKDLVEGAPKTVKEGVNKEEAAKMKEVLEKAGAKVAIQ